MKKIVNLNGYTALITGACSGIGLAYTKQLASMHCNVVMVDVNPAVNQVVNDINREFGVDAYPVNIDLADSMSAQKIYDDLQQKGICVDILVNNAGMFYFKELILLPVSKVEAMLRLHIETTTKLTYLFGRDMCHRQKGYVLNMASICADMPNPGLTMYAATKAYIKTFSKSMWYEFADYGVGVTCVSPGGVATGLYKVEDKWIKLGLKLGVLVSPEYIAKHAVKAMLKKRKHTIPKCMLNGFFVWLVNAIPTPLRMYFKRKVI